MWQKERKTGGKEETFRYFPFLINLCPFQPASKWQFDEILLEFFCRGSLERPFSRGFPSRNEQPTLNSAVLNRPFLSENDAVRYLFTPLRYWHENLKQGPHLSHKMLEFSSGNTASQKKGEDLPREPASVTRLLFVTALFYTGNFFVFYISLEMRGWIDSTNLV